MQLAWTTGLLVTLASTQAAAYTLKTSPGGAPVRWHRASVEFEVASGSSAEVADALRRAGSAWSAVPGTPALLVREGARAERTWAPDGVNGVYVLDRWPFPDRRLAVTVSSYVASTGELIDTDILVNGEMQLAVLDGERHAGDRYDLVLVLTHELGHALGLDESDVSGATMFHRIRPGETQRRELSVDDVDGALALYGMRSPALAGGCHVASRGGRAPAALILLGAAVALCRRSRRGGPRAHA